MKMIKQYSRPAQTAKIKHHAVFMRHKIATLLALTTTVFLLCIENVKAFTSPLTTPSSLHEKSLLFLATGAQTVTKRWKESGQSQMSMDATKVSPSQKTTPLANKFSQSSLLTLKMTFGFGEAAPSIDAPPMLDMKTSINAFGSWYNSMDPVARPPVYDE
jgi:hypothetical protein